MTCVRTYGMVLFNLADGGWDRQDVGWTSEGSSMATSEQDTCDWCEAEASYRTKDGACCKRHRYQLELRARFRIVGSGNSEAGDAADHLVDEGRRLPKRVAERITEYLAEHGKMSGRDICDDLGVGEVDVDLCEQAGHITRCPPHAGGVAPWFCLRAAEPEPEIFVSVVTHATGAVEGGLVHLCCEHGRQLELNEDQQPEWARLISADYRGVEHGRHTGICSICRQGWSE